MYALNKIVGWLTSPLGLFFLGLGVGALARRARSRAVRRLGRFAVVAALVLFWILGCGVTTRILGVPLEGEEPAEELADGPFAAIVVLGGGMAVHAHCGRPEMYASADRVWTAARQYRRTAAVAGDAKVVCTGGGVIGSSVRLLEDLGVPREAILWFEEPRNTEEEAQRLKAHLRPADGEEPRIALVTSAWHMPRAKTLFARAGFAVVPVPTDFEMHAIAEEPLRLGDFLPSVDALLRNGYALKEWVARVGYAVLRRR